MEEGWVSVLKRESSLRLSIFIDQDPAAIRNRKRREERKRHCSKHVYKLETTG